VGVNYNESLAKRSTNVNSTREILMFLGIEIGGTKLQIGLGEGDGTLAGLWRGTVDVAGGPEGIRAQILEAVPQLLAEAAVPRDHLQGVGIGFGGPVDDATQTVIKSHQIPGWDHFRLADWIGQMLGLPAALGNDADVAGLAEAQFGAGQGVSPIFYITIGSGIGGGFILDGAIYRGCGLGAAEIGHLLVDDPQDPQQKVPLEEVASGWAMGKRALWRLLDQPGTRTLLHELCNGDPNQLTGSHVGQAAAENDRVAGSILAEAIDALALAIRQMITLLCPRRVVIGGGVSLLGEELLFAPLRRRVATLTFPPFASCYAIVPAALGEAVVVHGALALARKQNVGA
jgi:glucokinase